MFDTNLSKGVLCLRNNFIVVCFKKASYLLYLCFIANTFTQSLNNPDLCTTFCFLSFFKNYALHVIPEILRLYEEGNAIENGSIQKKGSQQLCLYIDA